MIAAKMFVKPRFGRRRASGVWPPSNHGLNVERRANWPFCPRPAVLPRPEPTPRPRRIFLAVEPSGFASLLSVSAISDLLDRDEVEDLLDRAAERRGVRDFDGAADAAETEALQVQTLAPIDANHAANLFHAELRLHDTASAA